MKYKLTLYAFLSGFILFIQYGCKKNGTTTTAGTTSEGLVNTWTRVIDTATITLWFGADNTYLASVRGWPIQSGSYTNTSNAITLSSSAVYCIPEQVFMIMLFQAPKLL